MAIEFYLDEIVDADKDAIVRHFQDKELSDNMLSPPYPYTEADALSWLKLLAEDKKACGGLVTTFAIRLANGEMIGAIGFLGSKIGKHHAAELGYWLAKPYWGQGIVPKAVMQMCEKGFRDFGLVRITAHVFTFNDRSSRVLEKCGFEQEGYLRKSHCKNGQYLDSKLYALVKA